jgi:hypothetical protein
VTREEAIKAAVAHCFRKFGYATVRDVWVFPLPRRGCWLVEATTGDGHPTFGVEVDENGAVWQDALAHQYVAEVYAKYGRRAAWAERQWA